MKTVEVRNSSSVPQVVLIDGKQYMFQAEEFKTFDSDLGENLARKNRALEVINPAADLFRAEADSVYLANLTGNPDAPDEVEALIWSKQHKSSLPTQVPNPLKSPSTFKAKHDKGQIPTKDKAGKPIARNLGKITLEVVPYRTTPFPEHIAQFLLGRAGLCEKHMKGQLCRSRPQPAYWPDQSWDLGDIRDFLELHDPSANLGPKAEKFDAASDTEIIQAKNGLIRRLFFVYADPKRAIFGSKDFKEFQNAKAPSQADVKKSALAALRNSK